MIHLRTHFSQEAFSFAHTISPGKCYICAHQIFSGKWYVNGKDKPSPQFYSKLYTFLSHFQKGVRQTDGIQGTASDERANKKLDGFRATSLSTYDFSTLYTTLPHNLIKEKLLDLIEWTFKRALKNYGSLYLACNDRKGFFHFL